MIDVWQYSEYALDSEYATVLNMLGSQKVVNKIFHHKYLTGFWICLEFWNYQCYTGFCRKQPIIHVWQISKYSLGCQSYRAWIYMVMNMPWLKMVLHKLYFKDFHYFECLEFWICDGFECIRSLNMLYFRILNKILYRIGFWIYHGFKICQGFEYIRVLNMSSFIKKTLHHIDAWQGTDYSSGSAYTRVLNMPWFYKALKKMLHHRCLTGFQIFLRFWTCHDLKYARITQGSEQTLRYRYLVGFW